MTFDSRNPYTYDEPVKTDQVIGLGNRPMAVISKPITALGVSIVMKNNRFVYIDGEINESTRIKNTGPLNDGKPTGERVKSPIILGADGPIHTTDIHDVDLIMAQKVARKEVYKGREDAPMAILEVKQPGSGKFIKSFLIDLIENTKIRDALAARDFDAVHHELFHFRPQREEHRISFNITMLRPPSHGPRDDELSQDGGRRV